MGKPRPLTPEIVGLEIPSVMFDYEERDVILYALAVGARELEFVYERGL